MRKLRIAFIKFGGLAAGGTEKFLQTVAAYLPRDEFEIDYYYCDAAPYVGSDYQHADTDPARLGYMEAMGVNLIKFVVGAKDITTPTHTWLETNFWEIFNPCRYDFVQTAKAGPQEYPYFKVPLPVFEFVTLAAGVDHSPNIACSVHISEWQRKQWMENGGNKDRSAVVPIPAEEPKTSRNLRRVLGIPETAVVAGFHQRADDHIFSPIPLKAFGTLVSPGKHFVIMGGSNLHRKQAETLKLNNVHFLPHQGDSQQVSMFLNTIDIFAHGRHDGETFGAVFAEAMMHGKPCLSHRSAIANAQVETMGPGGLFAEDDIEYTQQLGILFSDSDKRIKLGARALSHAKSHYTVDACVKQVVHIYKRYYPLQSRLSITNAGAAAFNAKRLFTKFIKRLSAQRKYKNIFTQC